MAWGMRAAWRGHQLVGAAIRGVIRFGAVPVDQHLLALRRGEQRAACRSPRRDRRRSPPAARASAPSCARWSRARTGRCCIPNCTPARPRPLPPPASGRTCCAALRLHRADGTSPASPCRALLHVLQDKHHLEQRGMAQVAPGLHGLHQHLEGHVLVGIGAQRRPRARAAADRGRSARRSGRRACTRVLTKKPISPSSSPRLRLAMGVPTQMSSSAV